MAVLISSSLEASPMDRTMSLLSGAVGSEERD